MTRLVMTLESLGLPASHAKNLHDFMLLFQRWNKSINLSAAKSEDEVRSHVLDSLHVIPLLSGRQQVLDVGSGGGFPVVIAAICMPATQFVSLEPVHKKQAFLRTAARELGLANLDARAERIEDHAERDYDAATSRATFDLVEWLALGLSHVKHGGIAVGFEAVPRPDLPAGATRYPYDLDGKSRAIVVAKRA
jgi:16S rRNA (guanine527-N7)-methyltransferase